MKAIIVEDEQEGMTNLVLKLGKSCPEVEIIGKCDSGESAVREIRAKSPELIFLDIQLGSMTGFEVLKKVSNIPSQVIFTTAYDEYAIQAIRAKALDYLLKPIRPKELKRAVSLASERILTSDKISRILVPDGSSFKIIHTKNILYCLADNVNTNIYIKGSSKVFVVKTLKSIYAMLPKDQFYRISRSAVINIDKVASVHRSNRGFLIMENGEELGISPDNMRELLKKLSGSF